MAHRVATMKRQKHAFEERQHTFDQAMRKATTEINEARQAGSTQSTASKEAVHEVSEEPLLGGDRDEHGCIPSAGYSWCESKSMCIRVWKVDCPAEAKGPDAKEPEVKVSKAPSVAE